LADTYYFFTTTTRELIACPDTVRVTGLSGSHRLFTTTTKTNCNYCSVTSVISIDVADARLLHLYQINTGREANPQRHVNAEYINAFSFQLRLTVVPRFIPTLATTLPKGTGSFHHHCSAIALRC
jgi:hypothetical protein